MGLELVSGSRIQSASISIYSGAAMRQHAGRVLGAVAQLGERLICIQEVAGSIPTSSTRLVKQQPQGL